MSDAEPSARPLGPFGDPAPSDASPPPNGATPPTDPGGASHYKTLEDADRAARDFQSRYDQSQAALQKLNGQLAQFGGLEEALKLVQQVSAIAARPDFQAYQRGELAPHALPENDEFLSEEQREIRAVKAELAQLKQGSTQGQSQVHHELAGLRFERAETEMREMYGEHWEARRPQILREVQKLGANAGPRGLDLIDASLLNKAFLASFESPREFDEFSAKWRQSRDAAGRQLLASKGTTPPHTQAPAGVPEGQPKNLREAFVRGLAEARAAQNGSAPR